MRHLGLLLLLVVAPAMATSIVYKSEGADGVTILSDRPIKNATNQEVIRLDSGDAPAVHASNTQKPVTTTPAPIRIAQLDPATLQTKIAQARLNIEKAQNQLTTARISKLKAKHECEVAHYRSKEQNTTNSSCQAINSTNEEVQLAHARAALAQLEEQSDRIG